MNKAWKSLIFLLLLCGMQTASAGWVKHNTNSFTWFRDIFFVNDRSGWIVGTDGVIVSTEDGGSTWVQSRKFTSDALIQVHFTDEMNGWLLCERSIYHRGADPISYVRRTTDGGRTWEKIEFGGGGRERIVKLLFRADGRTSAFGEGGVFYQLQPDGTSWKRTVSGINYLLLDGAYSDDLVGAIVGTGGTIMFTNDAGFTWEKATVLGDRTPRFNAVFFGQKGAWAVGDKGSIFRSGGGGRLWRQQQSNVTADLNDVYFTSATSGWAVGEQGIILRTRDGGNTWFDVPSRTTHNLEKVLFTGSRGWAIGFGGTILTYEDGASDKERGSKPILMKRG